MRKEKFFFVINSLEAGGAEKVISAITPRLSKAYDVYVLLLNDSRFFDLPEDITVIPLAKLKHNVLMIPLFPLYILKLKRLIRLHQPKKIISFLEISNFINILSNKEAVISFRTSLDFFSGSGIVNFVYKFLIKHLYPRAKIIIVNSKENRLDISNKLQISPEKIKVIYNPIDQELVATKKQEEIDIDMSRSDGNIFITIGRLHKQKHIDVLIGIFREQQHGLDKFFIIGDGPERKNLEDLIKTNGLENNVFLLGKKQNVYKYLARADFFLFNSDSEGFPNVLIDAMSCDLPIITSDFKTGAREIIDPALPFDAPIAYPYYGQNGILLDKSSFVTEFKNIDLGKIKTNAAKNIEKFDVKKIAIDWKGIL